METNAAPVIFIHYGPSGFLRQTLRSARVTNPDKRVIFLGDASNRKLCPPGVDFAPIERFAVGEDLRRLRKAFVPIIGSAHRFNKQGGQEYWLRFVFERWFIILEFLKDEQIFRFWTFDSDTLIHCRLAAKEAELATYDATEQCCGRCLNGYISSRDVVESYTEKMIRLFQSPDYLDMQRERLKIHRGLAFNEMDAWQTHRDQEGLRTLPLGIPRNGEVFDDALAITKGWRVAAQKVRGRIPVKEIAFDEDSSVPYAFPENESSPVRLLTMNLSWLPDWLFRRLSPRKLMPDLAMPDKLRPVSFAEPLRERLVRTILETGWRLRPGRK